eukprot:6600379-Prorocentrum_lima.AAC.1
MCHQCDVTPANKRAIYQHKEEGETGHGDTRKRDHTETQEQTMTTGHIGKDHSDQDRESWTRHAEIGLGTL